MAAPPPPDDLAALHAACWQALQQASREPGHGWRLMTLATRAGDGEGADARTVVLRDVQADTRELLFYTDSRSPKVAQVRACPRGTLLAYCPALAWQLRLVVQLQVHTDGLEVSSRWARLKLRPAVAQDYLSALPPGSALGAPLEPARGTREHFAVLSAQVLALDWLALHPSGHRRAAFDAQGARWLQP